MVYINEEGYLERTTKSGRNPNGKGTYRDWWLVKYGGSESGRIDLHTVSFKKEWLGKRVRFKIEVLDD